MISTFLPLVVNESVNWLIEVPALPSAIEFRIAQGLIGKEVSNVPRRMFG